MQWGLSQVLPSGLLGVSLQLTDCSFHLAHRLRADSASSCHGNSCAVTAFLNLPGLHLACFVRFLFKKKFFLVISVPSVRLELITPRSRITRSTEPVRCPPHPTTKAEKSLIVGCAVPVAGCRAQLGGWLSKFLRALGYFQSSGLGSLSALRIQELIPASPKP